MEYNFLERLQPYVTKDEMKTKLKDKLDGVLFFDYCKRRMVKDDDTNKQLIMNEKFFDIRKEFDQMVRRTEFDHVVHALKSMEGVQPNIVSALSSVPTSETTALEGIQNLERA